MFRKQLPEIKLRVSSPCGCLGVLVQCNRRAQCSVATSSRLGGGVVFAAPPVSILCHGKLVFPNLSPFIIIVDYSIIAQFTSIELSFFSKKSGGLVIETIAEENLFTEVKKW